LLCRKLNQGIQTYLAQHHLPDVSALTGSLVLNGPSAC
jgi:hypothetical protein